MKKKKFVSKWLKTNTLEIVADRIKPIDKQDSWLLDNNLRSASALSALMRGEANRGDIDQLKCVNNMAIGLQKFDTGMEYRSITRKSADAIIAIAERRVRNGKFLATGPEIKALQDLLELHEAQLAICTVGDVNKAYEYVKNTLRTGDCRVMPSQVIGAKAC